MKTAGFTSDASADVVWILLKGVHFSLELDVDHAMTLSEDTYFRKMHLSIMEFGGASMMIALKLSVA